MSGDRSIIGAACFDLECSNLNADFGIILAAVVKPALKKPVIFRSDKLNPNWKTRRSDDSAICKLLSAELQKHDILVAHNGVDFDLPFLRTRLMINGLPPLPETKIVDPVKLARKHLRFASNRLGNIASALGVNQRIPVEGYTWMQAVLDGNIKAMDQITEKCLADVLTLEDVVMKLKHYTFAFNSWGSA